ncbi:FeoA family protein [Parapedobacter sp. DT-150]
MQAKIRVMSPSINQLKIGETATIVGYRSGDVPIKVYEMGLLPGVVLTMKQQLPFNGPVCVYIHNNPNAIALRRSEADLILIESLSAV